MIIIVDAYNLLRTIPPYKKTITDQERSLFINQLNAYARLKNHKIVLVFDGGSYHWPFKINGKKIQVVYSGINESADDYIKRYCDAHKGQDLLLVSSDRELNKYADFLNIPSLDSQDFYFMFMESLRTQKSGAEQNNKSTITIFHENAPDIDKLMIEASKTVSVKAEDVAERPLTVKKSQLSKHERALLKKLNKL